MENGAFAFETHDGPVIAFFLCNICSFFGYLGGVLVTNIFAQILNEGYIFGYSENYNTQPFEICSDLLNCHSRLVFARLLDVRGNLGYGKEKPTRKTCFFLLKEAPGSTHLSRKVLLGDISLMSTKLLLYFHEKKILERERVFKKT